MSCAAPWNPPKCKNSYYIADVATILVDDQYKTDDQYGEMAKACLHVRGFVRRITSVMEQIRDDPGVDACTGISQLDVSKKYRHLYVDDQLDHNISHELHGF
jgi:hypothetical protein